MAVNFTRIGVVESQGIGLTFQTKSTFDKGDRNDRVDLCCDSKRDS